MSNWARIIVCWKSIDGSPGLPDDTWHRQRADEILAKVSEDEEAFSPLSELQLVGGAAMAEPSGMSCEVTLVCEANHSPTAREIMAVVAPFPWRYPEHVCVMVRDEHAERFSVAYADEHGAMERSETA